MLLYHQLPLLCTCFGSMAGQVWVGCLTSKNNVLSPHNTELTSLIHVLVHSTWQEEQDGWTFQHFDWFPYDCWTHKLFKYNSLTICAALKNPIENEHLLKNPNERKNWLNLCTYSVKRSCWWTVDYSSSICCLQSYGWVGISKSRTSSKTHIQYTNAWWTHWQFRFLRKLSNQE